MSLTTEGPAATDEAGDRQPQGGEEQPARAACSARPRPSAMGAVPVRLGRPTSDGMTRRFASSDPSPGLDLARRPVLARLMRDRRFQFLLVLPNQIVFWTVIFVGLLGTAVPGLNFGTAITWYVWFCLVFVMMVVVGRAWCSMCPFGGFAEWVQRRALFRRTQKALGLGLKFPEPLARLGFLIPVGSFVLLTWIEEFFNIAGPGNPADTSFMVIGIVLSALVFFLVFERRTFCRYVCPLTTLIGTVGSMGSVAGFRTRDREICLACTTKDCMRGSENGYGCPWFEWVGSATSNLMCGLCAECFKNCPKDNIGLFAQPPLTSVIQPVRRRWDIGVVAIGLLGIVVFQQLNALPLYTVIDGFLNRVTHFPGYPNPLDYLGVIAGVMAVIGAYAMLLRALLAKRTIPLRPLGASVDRRALRQAWWQGYAQWLTPIAYAMIPVVAADYLSRQLPKLFDHALRIVPAISDPFDLGWNLFGTAHSSLYNVRLLSTAGVVHVQMAVMIVGTLGALYATWTVVRRDMAQLTARPTVLLVATLTFVALSGIALTWLYAVMGGAQ